MKEEIDVPVWCSWGGGMMVRRDSLEPSHPESTYSYIKNVLGEIPEDFGYYSCDLSLEDIDLLSKLSNEAIFAECKRRESRIMAEELYA